MSDPNQYPPAPAAQPGRPPQRPAPAPPRPPGRAGDAPAWTSKARPVLDVAARILCLALGAALLIAGLVGLFTGVTQGQLVTVLIVGFLLVLMPAIVDRLRSLKTRHFEIRLVRQVADNARKSAEALRRLGMEYELDSYATIYTELRGPELTGRPGADTRPDRPAGVQRRRGREVRPGRDQGPLPERLTHRPGARPGPDGGRPVADRWFGAARSGQSVVDRQRAVPRPEAGPGRLGTPLAGSACPAAHGDRRPAAVSRKGEAERALAQQIRGLAGSPRIG